MREINQQFLKTYDKTALAHLKDIKHVVVYLRGQLLLLRQNELNGYEEAESSESATRNSTYRQLKTFAHSAVTVNMLVADKQAHKLREFNKKLKQLTLNHEAEILPYRQFINESIYLIDSILSHWDIQESDKQLIENYNQTINKALNNYMMAAARLQLQSMSATMKDWSERYQIKAETLRIVIVCASGPREGMIERQFFESWLQKQNGSKRLIYQMEMLHEQMPQLKIDKLIDFVGKQELNKSIGKQLLNDENALFKDLLAEHADSILQGLDDEPIKGHCPYS